MRDWQVDIVSTWDKVKCGKGKVLKIKIVIDGFAQMSEAEQKAIKDLFQPVIESDRFTEFRNNDPGVLYTTSDLELNDLNSIQAGLKNLFGCDVCYKGHNHEILFFARGKLEPFG